MKLEKIGCKNDNTVKLEENQNFRQFLFQKPFLLNFIDGNIKLKSTKPLLKGIKMYTCPKEQMENITAKSGLIKKIYLRRTRKF